jgi:DNA-binding IclR family transcriptional regulator
MDFTLTKTEWRILQALEAGSTIPQLAQDLGLHRTFAYHRVLGLIEKGLVAKQEPTSATYRATVRVRVEPNTERHRPARGSHPLPVSSRHPSGG